MLLVERGLFESRARARAAIEAGVVHRRRQAGREAIGNHRGRCRRIRRNRRIPTSRAAASSSAGALEQYPIDIEGHVCLDVGASTGGFTEVLLANGASLVFAIDVGHGQLHPSLHDHPKIVSMEETDIRNFEGKRLPARPDVVVIDVSFISLKAVLPVALSLAAAPMHLLALIKPQFEARATTFQARHHPQRDGASGSLRRHRGVRGLAGLHRYPGVSVIDHGRRRQYRILHRRAPWLNDLVIDHVGHLGDGVAVADGQNVYVPYTLGGETVEVAPVPAIPTAARLMQVERASPERIAPFCPHFGVCGGCAIQHWETERYRAWKRDLVVETLAQAGIDCEVTPLVDAHGAGRRRITLHARMGTHDVLKVGFAAANSHDIIPIDRCPILDPAPRRRARRGLGDRRAADLDRQAARHPDHRHR